MWNIHISKRMAEFDTKIPKILNPTTGCPGFELIKTANLHSTTFSQWVNSDDTLCGTRRLFFLTTMMRKFFWFPLIDIFLQHILMKWRMLFSGKIWDPVLIFPSMTVWHVQGSNLMKKFRLLESFFSVKSFTLWLELHW